MYEIVRARDYLMDVERRAIVIALALMLAVLLSLTCFLGYVLWLGRASAQADPNALSFQPALEEQSQVFPNSQIWERIQARGRIIAGVAPDYPPFAYIDDDLQLEGLDIAVANEIGRRLGYPVEFTQMPLDALVNALNLGQADIALGGLSITPERQAIVDFTNVYYTGQDAVIAPAHSNLTVTRVEDLAQVRVGVQRGSVFEAWLRSTLVDPGLMPVEYLVVRDSIEDLITGLTEAVPSLDAAVLDDGPAASLVQGRPLKLVARGLNPQGYAFAVAKGSETFLALVNRTLVDMQNDGTLASLAAMYTQPPPVVILPTAIPTAPPIVILPTPIPTVQLPQAGAPRDPACQDALTFVSDLTYPDQNMTSPPVFSPGEQFQKGWRVRNTGGCTWSAAYTLAPAGSKPKEIPVTGAPAALTGAVPPGGEVDLYVTLTAPAQPGRYQSFWALKSSTGQAFGDSFWAGFDVAADAPAAPASGGLPSVPVQVFPTPTAIQAAALPAVVQPSIISQFASTPQQVIQGSCVSLTWRYAPSGVTRASLHRHTTLIVDDAPASGVFIDCPQEAGRIEYRLALEGTEPAAAVQVVEVYPPSAPQSLAPTPASPPASAPLLGGAPPVISTFAVDSSEVVWGRCVNLTWVFGGASITTAELFRNDERIAEALLPTDDWYDCPPDWGDYTYRLTIASPAAAPVSAAVLVKVRLGE